MWQTLELVAASEADLFVCTLYTTCMDMRCILGPMLQVLADVGVPKHPHDHMDAYMHD